MNKWLKDYAYHIHVSGLVFVIAGGLALFIALATVSYHTIRAVTANPVRSLRSE
jgi:putative ABC transport system permease protein